MKAPTGFDLARAVRAIEQRVVSGRPTVVAIDGHSGVGKSTFARELGRTLGAAVIEGDDFFAGGIDLRTDTPAERAEACIDWRRQRKVIEDLRRNHRATWRRFDWIAFNGNLEDREISCEPRPIVVMEGVYSARPELSDLIDLRMLLTVSSEVRLRRLLAREGAIGAWEKQWHEAETYYFTELAPPAWFDLVLDAAE